MIVSILFSPYAIFPHAPSPVEPSRGAKKIRENVLSPIRVVEHGGMTDVRTGIESSKGSPLALPRNGKFSGGIGVSGCRLLYLP